MSKDVTNGRISINRVEMSSGLSNVHCESHVCKLHARYTEGATYYSVKNWKYKTLAIQHKYLRSTAL